MLNFTNDDILARLRFDNPWWQTGQSLASTRAYVKRDYFQPFEKLARQEKPRRSVVLLGPRRTGKTVMMFQLIDELLKQESPPQNILYASLDTPILARRSMTQILDLYKNSIAPDQSQTIYILFDEVQYLKDWNQELKSLTDSHLDYKFIVSGSAAAALKSQSQESGAGRFTDFILPPLTFAEYLHLTNQEKELVVTNKDTTGGYSTPSITTLNEAFVRYLNFGGYPELALSKEMQESPERYVRSDIIDKVLLRDLPSLYGITDTQELYSLFNTLAFNTGNEVSIEKLSQGSGVSKNTIKRYLDYLESAFLIRTIERIDKGAKHFERARTFKVYLANASLRSALFGPLESDDERFGYVAETAVVAQWMHDPDFKHNLRYARWENREVDIVCLKAGTQKPFWAVEVKWSDLHLQKSQEVQGLIDFAMSNQDLYSVKATTKTVSGTLRTRAGAIPVEPTALYCYSVGKNILKSLSGLSTVNVTQPELFKHD